MNGRRGRRRTRSLWAPMTALDWIIIAFAVAFAIYGSLTGFVMAALSLAGIAVGAFLGARLGPLLLGDGSRSPYAPMFALLGAVLVAGLLASALGRLGERLHERRWPTLANAADLLGGAALSAALALGLVWLLAAVAVGAPATRALRDDVQRSVVLRALNQVLPPSGPLLNALARFDPLPRLQGPLADVAPPTAAIGRDREVKAAAPSVVRIVGTACGLGIEGSGWVAGNGLVVTNAHVVAGQDDTAVQRDGHPPGLRARAVHFDPRNDLAILRVDGLDRPRLKLRREPRGGLAAAILGFPEAGPYDVRAGRLGNTRTVVSQDAYGNGPIERSVTSLRGLVRPGNSGGPMVDSTGRVVATIFAARTSGPAAGFGVPNEVVRAALRRTAGPVSTGPCTR